MEDSLSELFLYRSLPIFTDLSLVVAQYSGNGYSKLTTVSRVMFDDRVQRADYQYARHRVLHICENTDTYGMHKQENKILLLKRLKFSYFPFLLTKFFNIQS